MQDRIHAESNEGLNAVDHHLQLLKVPLHSMSENLPFDFYDKPSPLLHATTLQSIHSLVEV